MMISICIATYKRPDHLKNVLHAYATLDSPPDFEVVVSDNDPEASARIVCDEARTAGLHVNYMVNESNLGMVGNFNKSLSRAIGDYVVFNTDDDMPSAALLKTLVALKNNNAGYGAYFGAAGTFFADAQEALSLGKQYGLHQQLAPRLEGSVLRLNPQEFITRFFDGSIFPYFLWSTGMVKRDIALRIGGMPSYGSPYLTDFSYIALAGSQEGMVAINTLLGYQTIHSENFGKLSNCTLAEGTIYARDFIINNLPAQLLTARLRRSIDNFIGWWVVSQLVWMRKLAKFDKELDASLAQQIRVLITKPFFIRLYPRYLARAYCPLIGKILNKARKIIFQLHQ